MAKKRKSSNKPATISREKKVDLPLSNSWNTMINWLVVLVLILPVLVSYTTIDPILTIRYIFLSLFVLLFCVTFFLFKKDKAGLPANGLTGWVFALGLGYGVWSLASGWWAINGASAI